MWQYHHTCLAFCGSVPLFSVFDFLPVLLVCCLFSVDIWFKTTSGCRARNHKNMPLFFWFLGNNSGYMATPLIFWILGLSFSIWLSAGACQDNHTCPLLFSSHCLLTIRTWSVSLLVGDRGWGESGTNNQQVQGWFSNHKSLVWFMAHRCNFGFWIFSLLCRFIE